MERTTFLKNYRIRLQYDGTAYEPASAGSTTSYEAVDERTGEPVSVTLIPTESFDPAERERFEEQVSIAQKLRHVNIAKVFDFGREGDDFVYVSERLAGETLASWVRSHGPMQADAALRVGEQIVSVLSSAGFHKLPYPPIQPLDLVLVPGQTAEGTWPLVKVTNFGLPALMARPEPQPIEPDVPGKAAREHAVTDQRFSLPTTDIRSEIYSLGVTLYFLLSDVALSAETLQRGPKFSGFPKPLRTLLGQLLHRDPDRRPKDLLVVTEMIRESLGKIERRRALSDRYGIPLRTTVPRPREARPRRLVRTAAVVGVLLLLAAAIAPVVSPDSISKLVRGIQKPKQIGVLIGVPDTSPAATGPRTAAQVPRNTSSAPPAVVSSQPVNPPALPETPAPANAATTPNPFHVAPADVQQAQIASAQPQPVAPTNSAENAAAATPDTSVSAAPDANSSAQANTEPPPTTASQSTSQSREKSVASKSKRARASRSSGPRTVAQIPRNTSSAPPAVVSSQPVNPPALAETPAPANAATTPNPFHVAPADVQQAQIANAQPQPAAPTNSAENSAAATPDTSVSADAGANSSAQANTEPPPTTASQSTAQSKKKSVASTAKRARSSRSSAAYSARGRTGSVRSRVMGITPDGRLILRLPSGRTAVVAPDDEESVPRHRNRVYIDRDQMFGSPPGLGPDYFPDD